MDVRLRRRGGRGVVLGLSNPESTIMAGCRRRWRSHCTRKMLLQEESTHLWVRDWIVDLGSANTK